MRRALPLAVSLSGLLLLAGCADAGAVKVDPPTAGDGGSARPANTEGTFAKEGWFGSADGLHARIAIKSVERQGPKSVLRYSVTSLDSSTKSVTFAIHLLDPVGRRLYRPTGSTSGDDFTPGATREMAAEYPAIPPTVQKVSVLTPGTAGEFTGIPVTGTATPPATGPEPETGRELGTGTEPETGTEPGVGAEAETGVQAETGVEIETGSPTGTGTPTSTASGTGEPSPESSAPLAENPVELHDILEEESGDGSPSASAGPSATASHGAAGPPAEFRAEDGKTVASRTARFGEDERRLDVKPFYRDGAYIVAVFDIVNEGPGTTPPDASYPHKDYPGGAFTAFSVQVPESETVYRAVRIGPGTPGTPSAYVDPGRAVFRTEVSQPVRGFLYLPAPPGDLSTVAFDAGPFGKVGGVPVN